jgi:transcriptional regulator with XRE-family HTH domain
MNRFSKEKLEASMFYADLDVKELAKKSTVGVSTLYEILNGKKKNPQADTLSKLSIALNVNVNDFFHDDSISIIVPIVKAQSPAEENKEILSSISKLDLEDKKLFKLLLERFNKS